MAAVNLLGSYNYLLVALSVLIAMFASYAALDLAGRVTAAGGWTRVVWLLGGAGAMGTGIWSMHYIGMLAFILPIPVAYHWPTVLLSLFAAILASVVALGMVSRQKMGWFRALAGSVLMGAGISSMHYIGMAAMRLPAICQFNSFLVILSVVFAVLISLAALWITFHFRDEKTGIGGKKLAGAVVMGAAIPVMHYTGMAAASFTPSGMPADTFHAVSISTLGAAGIAAVTFILLGLALLTSWVDRRFAARTLEVQEEKLQQSEAYLAEAQRLSHTGSFGWRPSSGEIIWSDETFRIFQYDRSTKPTAELVLQRVHPEDAALVNQIIERASQDGKDFDFEHRLLMPDGSVKHVHVVAHAERDASGELEFVGAVMDTTERKRAEAMRDGESRILEMIARDAPLEEILENLVRVVEAQFAGLLCSVLILDQDGQHARHGAAPSLPKSYTDAIDGLCIGPKAGSCGTAMYRRQPLVVTDILQDPLWESYREVAEPYGLRACWSTPILAHSGKALGSFAMYYREPRSPSSAETRALEMATHLAGIAIEREQAEETLRRSESYLAEAQRLTHTGSWAWRVAGGKATHLSEEWYRIYGFDPEKGMSAWEERVQRIHPEDRAKWQAVVDRAIAERSDYEVEARILLPGGTVKYIRTVGHPVLSASGDLVQFVGSTMDITERKHADEALRRSEGYLAEAQRLTTTGSWAWNAADRQSVYWSQENYRLFGFDPQGGIPSDEAFYERVHPGDRDRVRKAVFLERPNEGSHFDVEFRIVLPGGAIKYVRSTGHPVRNQSGDLLEYVGTSVDVTERKRVDQERERLRQLQADLARVTRVTTMGELTASLAHEVNQPIAAASTNANTCLRWLAGDTPNIEEARAAAMRIVKDGKRAAEIISRIRQVFKKGTSERELVDVNEIIREMIVLLRGEITRYNIMVGTDLAEDLPQVMADRVQLQQVLMNLMINGIEAMKDADGTRELAITSQRTENEKVVVSITDRGVGLPLQQAEQIFNAFFTTKPHGTGMGLRISRSIIESHGGRLWAADNSPRGASFFFNLPAKVETHE
jgi:PAS domain S-box-containing protein